MPEISEAIARQRERHAYMAGLADFEQLTGVDAEVAADKHYPVIDAVEDDDDDDLPF